MSDDAQVAATTIPMEDGAGASTPLPPDLALPADPATPPTDPQAVVRVDEPAPPEPEPDEHAKAGLLASLGRERHENKTLKQFRDQASPILLALQKHPDLLMEIQARENGQRAAPAAAPLPPPTAAPGPSQDELEQLAKDLVLYKPDGSGLPDTEAARRTWGFINGQVQQIVGRAIQQHVTPIQQTVVRGQAQQARDAIQQTAKLRGADGPALDNLIDQFMRADPSMLNDPQVGAQLVIAAAGMKALGMVPGADGTPVPAGAAPPAAPVVPGAAPAPVFTERPGARTPVPVTLAPIEQRAAKARGMTPEAWGAMTQPLTTAKPGQQHIVLEE